MPPLDKPPLDKPPLDRPAEDRQRAYGDAARTLAAIEARRILDHLLQLQAIPSPTGYTDSIVRHVCGWLHEHGIDYELDRKSTRSELQSLMRISYDVFCLKKKKKIKQPRQ